MGAMLALTVSLAGALDFIPPKGLPAVEAPEDNPLTREKVELGRLLYFDKRLSRDSTVSCASCHDPRMGWTDRSPVSTGIRGQRGGRSAPTVLNSAYSELQFWDGRAGSLEEQAKGPIENPVEMGFTHKEAEERFAGIKGYAPYFKAAFGDDKVTIDRIAQAIASFERTIVTGDAPFDRGEAGEADAMSPAAERGKVLFFGKANCSVCHSGPSFSDSDFHNLGVGINAKKADWGRWDKTQNESDKGAFKTPTLRNLRDTAPYMHDGSQRTLREVVDFYDKGGEPNPWLSRDVRKLSLSEAEKNELLAFLDALNGDPVDAPEPSSFPR